VHLRKTSSTHAALRPPPDFFPFSFAMRWESNVFAFSSSARRSALKPRPPRLIKYVSIRIPEEGPFGDTFFDASSRAIVAALFVNSPFSGCVESVFTFATQRFVFFFACAMTLRSATSLNMRSGSSELKNNLGRTTASGADLGWAITLAKNRRLQTKDLLLMPVRADLPQYPGTLKDQPGIPESRRPSMARRRR